MTNIDMPYSDKFFKDESTSEGKDGKKSLSGEALNEGIKRLTAILVRAGQRALAHLKTVDAAHEFTNLDNTSAELKQRGHYRQILEIQTHTIKKANFAVDYQALHREFVKQLEAFFNKLMQQTEEEWGHDFQHPIVCGLGDLMAPYPGIAAAQVNQVILGKIAGASPDVQAYVKNLIIFANHYYQQETNMVADTKEIDQLLAANKKALTEPADESLAGQLNKSLQQVLMLCVAHARQMQVAEKIDFVDYHEESLQKTFKKLQVQLEALVSLTAGLKNIPIDSGDTLYGQLQEMHNEFVAYFRSLINSALEQAAQMLQVDPDEIRKILAEMKVPKRFCKSEAEIKKMVTDLFGEQYNETLREFLVTIAIVDRHCENQSNYFNFYHEDFIKENEALIQALPTSALEVEDPALEDSLEGMEKHRTLYLT